MYDEIAFSLLYLGNWHWKKIILKCWDTLARRKKEAVNLSGMCTNSYLEKEN